MRFFLLLLLAACSTPTNKELKKQNVRAQHIYRTSDEQFFSTPTQVNLERAPFPWEQTLAGGHPRITREHFRCKGCRSNPSRIKKREGREAIYFNDCSAHSLPLRDNQEFVYPCLIELLNALQEKTEHRVVITSGHKCPMHNTYTEPNFTGWGSKHMIGAEVDFYIEGMEQETAKILDLIQEIYKGEPYSRYEKSGLNVSTPPWYNEEVFIKLYLADEGRDGDNLHPYPYFGIQVRYDRDLKKRVRFEEELSQNFLRY